MTSPGDLPLARRKKHHLHLIINNGCTLLSLQEDLFEAFMQIGRGFFRKGFLFYALEFLSRRYKAHE